MLELVSLLLYTAGFYGWFTIDPIVFESSASMNDHALQMWHEQQQLEEHQAAADAQEAATALEEDDYEGAASQTGRHAVRSRRDEPRSRRSELRQRCTDLGIR